MHPALRDDLELHSASPGFDGSPQWTIHDPLRNLFFSIDWITFEFMSRWEQGDAKNIIASIQEQTTLEVTEDDYENIFEFLLTNELLQIEGNQGLTFLKQQATSRKSNLLTWLIHNYLFFRIPLFNCDKWLTKNVNKVNYFYKSFFIKLTLIIGIVGLLQIYNQFNDFSSTFLDMFSWKGLVAYFFATLVVKFIHELAHAFTAKRFGCKVPTMGIAFLVMMPLAYTDTNDVWKLKDRKSRLLVDSAGVISELIIAAWSIFIWSLLPHGILKNIFYILGATSWINTLLINLSPFMRFDGYYTLSDFLKVSNLHTRAFALAKWHFRKNIFGFSDPIPEPFPNPLKNFLIIFAWITGIYRLVVFFSIAFLVYHFFIKALGIVLFLIEIIWFIARPIYSEVIYWLKRKDDILNNPKKNRAIYISGIILFIILFPLDFRLREVGILKPKDRYYIFAIEPSQLSSNPPMNGQSISKGEMIVQLSSPDLTRQLNIAKQEEHILNSKVTSASFNDELKNNLQANFSSLHMAESNVRSLEDMQKQLNTEAPFPGHYYELSPNLKDGDWIGKGAKLGMLVGENNWMVEAYIPEDSIQRLNIGYYGKFFSETAGNDVLSLKIVSIDPNPIKILSDPIYGTASGGSVVTRNLNDKLVTDQPYHKITFVSEKPKKLLATQRGYIIVYAKPQSIMSFSIRHIMNLIRKEISF